MKYLLLCISLAGCALPTGPASNLAVQARGGGLYSVSEMNAADPLGAAVQFCAPRSMAIQATMTESGFYSGRSYNVLVFKCR